jgi:hypothetical protein
VVAEGEAVGLKYDRGEMAKKLQVAEDEQLQLQRGVDMILAECAGCPSTGDLNRIESLEHHISRKEKEVTAICDAMLHGDGMGEEKRGDIEETAGAIVQIEDGASSLEQGSDAGIAEPPKEDQSTKLAREPVTSTETEGEQKDTAPATKLSLQGDSQIAYCTTDDDEEVQALAHEIPVLVEAGSLVDETPFWAEGMDEWTTYGHVSAMMPSREEIGEPPVQKKRSKLWVRVALASKLAVDNDSPIFYEVSETENGQAMMHEIPQLLASGAITDDTHVWVEGLEEWMAYGHAKALLPSSRTGDVSAVAVDAMVAVNEAAEGAAVVEEADATSAAELLGSEGGDSLVDQLDTPGAEAETAADGTVPVSEDATVDEEDAAEQKGLQAEPAPLSLEPVTCTESQARSHTHRVTRTKLPLQWDSQIFYATDDDENAGALAHEIPVLVEAGSLVDETPFWAEGMDEWTTYGHAREMVPSPEEIGEPPVLTVAEVLNRTQSIDEPTAAMCIQFVWRRYLVAQKAGQLLVDAWMDSPGAQKFLENFDGDSISESSDEELALLQLSEPDPADIAEEGKKSHFPARHLIYPRNLVSPVDEGGDTGQETKLSLQWDSQIAYAGADDENAGALAHEIPVLVEAGSLVDETPFWAEGMDEWTTYGHVSAMMPSREEIGEPPVQKKRSKLWGRVALASKLAVDNDSPIYYATSKTALDIHESTEIHEIPQLVADGIITDETRVWVEGLDEWTTYGHAKALIEARSERAAAAARGSPRAADGSPLAKGDPFRAVAKEATKVAAVEEEAAVAAAVAEDIEEFAEEDAAAGAEDGEEDVIVFYNTELGEQAQATLTELQGLVEQGNINESTAVWSEGMNEWKSFHEVTEDSKTGLGKAIKKENDRKWASLEKRRRLLAKELEKVEAEHAGFDRDINGVLMECHGELSATDREKIAGLKQSANAMQKEINAICRELLSLQRELQNIVNVVKQLYGVKAAKVFMKAKKLALDMHEQKEVVEALEQSRLLAEETKVAFQNNEAYRTAIGSVGANETLDASQVLAASENVLGSVFSSVDSPDKAGMTSSGANLKDNVLVFAQQNEQLRKLVGGAQDGASSNVEAAAHLNRVQAGGEDILKTARTPADIRKALVDNPEFVQARALNCPARSAQNPPAGACARTSRPRWWPTPRGRSCRPRYLI